MALIEHRKAKFDYEIIETHEVGIELLGHEVKSLRNGQGTLEASYGIIRGGELYILGMFIPPYQIKNTPTDYDPRRTRRLLITKKEIKVLERDIHEKGLTLVPLRVYNKGAKLKIALGLMKGKKKHDKRASIKKRDTDREIRRTLKLK